MPRWRSLNEFFESTSCSLPSWECKDFLMYHTNTKNVSRHLTNYESCFAMAKGWRHKQKDTVARALLRIRPQNGYTLSQVEWIRIFLPIHHHLNLCVYRVVLPLHSISSAHDMVLDPCSSRMYSVYGLRIERCRDMMIRCGWSLLQIGGPTPHFVRRWGILVCLT